MNTFISFTILGEPASKANSRELVSFGRRPGIIKSAKARAYEAAALLQIPDHAKQMLSGPVGVRLRIFYASHRPDLDESVILDAMQARFSGRGKQRQLVRRGVYLNDRQVKEKHVYHGVDNSAPRAEVAVWALGKAQT
jgi:Holliday junction resolvase RusA-like endonuclease